MKKNIKRNMILRTLSGFLGVWLAFSGLVSWILIRNANERTEGELAQTLVNDIAPLDYESWEVEQWESALDFVCLWDSRILAGSAFRHVEDFALLAESRFLMQAMIPSEGGESKFDLVGCSPLDFMDEAQYRQLAEWVVECQTRNTEANQSFREGKQEEMPSTEAVDLFISGWVHGSAIYPTRLAAAHRFRDIEDFHITGEPNDLSGMEIWMDLRIDTEKVYQKSAEKLERGKYVENILVTMNCLANYETRKPLRLDAIREALPLTRDEAVRAWARRECSVLPDLEVLMIRGGKRGMKRVNLTAGRWVIAGLKSEEPVPVPAGLKREQSLLYMQKGDLEFVFLAETHPVRELLPALVGIWLASLLLVLAAGGLVCRAMCRVYDRQAALEQSRRDTTNALAHDLKTPLALIHGYTENLLFRVKPEKHDHYLRQIQRETERMDSLLGGMLNLSRLETGALPLHREAVDLLALMEESAARWQAATEAQKINLMVEGGGTVSADRELFGRMLDNLLSNALRHTPEGGQIRVTADESGLSVENTGEAIPENVLPRLFEAYYTHDRSRGGRQHGLGLAIVRAAAELQGMSAQARNTGTGVCIDIRF